MEFDVKFIPFSRYGSYLVFSHISGSDKIKEGLYLRSIHGGDDDMKIIFRLELIKEGEAIPFQEIASPTLLRLESVRGYAEICICEPDIVRVKGKGVGLRLTMDCKAYDYAISVDDRRWEINNASNEIKFMLTSIKGRLSVNAPWRINRSEYIIADFTPNDNDEFECAIEEFVVNWKKNSYEESFESCHSKVEKEYMSWLNNTLETGEKYKNARELASYITWSCVVSPKGKITRPAMYMSKNWMTNIWSWDNCFNAMALAKNNPKLAWDQIMIFVDNQDESGTFPDFINDKFALWNFCKPPIQGWVLKWIMERTDFIKKQHVEEIYKPLVKWTEWWFKYRDSDNDGILQYNHGNDSGWDNSTVFHEGVPVESPDLTSFLIIQMELLSEFALILNKTEEHKKWKEKANITLDKLLKHSWDGKRFVAFKSGTHKRINSDSLLLFIPIILGNRLPNNIIKSLVDGLKDNRRFLTEYGLATESISSDYYIPNGYWRGPIWAPSTMIIVDSLKKIGEEQFAKEIAQRYCSMILKNGMAENFNALTGEGLCDTAFTWTSSVFLILANEYC
ncbi:amylo-alpha-1,6-glucosidase [Caloranaerobacter azorensis]|uniref:Mannosylglycerate hydrolase MGH1-like glycoside hydrolase domain-containing protein n=1 Tax=Caloranaerobacter azorensis TaxID=116090 RepID=A0A6P1YD24_9FIRM|nr:trehalase family glycosidase [Caloranaerobacter azorensis]QIB27034.1 hypothetical protein G3A45_06850 [Caloranaerobacter azorensis]